MLVTIPGDQQYRRAYVLVLSDLWTALTCNSGADSKDNQQSNFELIWTPDIRDKTAMSTTANCGSEIMERL